MRINLFATRAQLEPFLRQPPPAPTAHAEGADFANLLSDLKKTNPGSDEKRLHSSDAAPGGGRNIQKAGVPPEQALPPPELELPPLEPRLPKADSVNELTAAPPAPELIRATRATTSAPSSGLTPISVESAWNLIEGSGNKHGVDPLLGLAVAFVESSLRPSVVSPDRHQSKGLFQLLDRTGKELLQESGHKKEYNPFDPELNTDLGMRYLRSLHDLFTSSTELPNGAATTPAANSTSLEKLAVAAFNAGQGRVAAAQKRAETHGLEASEYDAVRPYLPSITQEYVDKVMAAKQRFAGDIQVNREVG